MVDRSKLIAFLSPHVSDPDVEDILEDIQDNIDGHIHGPVSGFIFPREDAVRKAADEATGRYALSSTAPSPEDFLQWFSNFSSAELNGARWTWHTCCQGLGNGSAHLFLRPSKTFHLSLRNRWDDVQAIGQFFEDDSISYQDGLLGLCALAREVFISQPTRRFLHGLYIRKSQVEVWTFDRSGIYCCETFDVQNESARFPSLIMSFRLMMDKDLGGSEVIQKDYNGQFIRLEDSAWNTLGNEKLYLGDEPISQSEDLVGTCTACYRARLPTSDGWEYVVKFKWCLISDRPEEEMLKLAKERNAWGVVSVDYYQEFRNTANLRQNLQWGPYRRFRQSESSEFTGDIQTILGCTTETEKPFENRVFSCAVNSPAGRPLHTFKTRLELLKALRDAVKGHRSLFKDARILHQDVSAYNIIITDSPNENVPKGILIDLDVAMDLDVGPRKPGEVTGTRPFMSIGILRCRPHRYRHDLESFFYVFLWTVISNGRENPPVDSKLRVWNRGSWYESAMQKTHDMHKGNFGDILAEFLPEHNTLKPLAEALRLLLFPTEDGELWTGTNSAPEFVNALYAGIIGAFDGAIEREKASLTHS